MRNANTLARQISNQIDRTGLWDFNARLAGMPPDDPLKAGLVSPLALRRFSDSEEKIAGCIESRVERLPRELRAEAGILAWQIVNALRPAETLNFGQEDRKPSLYTYNYTPETVLLIGNILDCVLPRHGKADAETTGSTFFNQANCALNLLDAAGAIGKVSSSLDIRTVLKIKANPPALLWESEPLQAAWRGLVERAEAKLENIPEQIKSLANVIGSLNGTLSGQTTQRKEPGILALDFAEGIRGVLPLISNSFPEAPALDSLLAKLSSLAGNDNPSSPATSKLALRVLWEVAQSPEMQVLDTMLARQYSLWGDQTAVECLGQTREEMLRLAQSQAPKIEEALERTADLIRENLERAAKPAIARVLNKDSTLAEAVSSALAVNVLFAQMQGQLAAQLETIDPNSQPAQQMEVLLDRLRLAAGEQLNGSLSILQDGMHRMSSAPRGSGDGLESTTKALQIAESLVMLGIIAVVGLGCGATTQKTQEQLALGDRGGSILGNYVGCDPLSGDPTSASIPKPLGERQTYLVKEAKFLNDQAVAFARQINAPEAFRRVLEPRPTTVQWLQYWQQLGDGLFDGILKENRDQLWRIYGMLAILHSLRTGDPQYITSFSEQYRGVYNETFSWAPVWRLMRDGCKDGSCTFGPYYGCRFPANAAVVGADGRVVVDTLSRVLTATGLTAEQLRGEHKWVYYGASAEVKLALLQDLWNKNRDAALNLLTGTRPLELVQILPGLTPAQRTDYYKNASSDARKVLVGAIRYVPEGSVVLSGFTETQQHELIVMDYNIVSRLSPDQQRKYVNNSLKQKEVNNEDWLAISAVMAGIPKAQRTADIWDQTAGVNEKNRGQLLANLIAAPYNRDLARAVVNNLSQDPAQLITFLGGVDEKHARTITEWLFWDPEPDVSLPEDQRTKNPYRNIPLLTRENIVGVVSWILGNYNIEQRNSLTERTELFVRRADASLARILPALYGTPQGTAILEDLTRRAVRNGGKALGISEYEQAMLAGARGLTPEQRTMLMGNRFQHSLINMLANQGSTEISAFLLAGRRDLTNAASPLLSLGLMELIRQNQAPKVEANTPSGRAQIIKMVITNDQNTVIDTLFGKNNNGTVASCTLDNGQVVKGNQCSFVSPDYVTLLLRIFQAIGNSDIMLTCAGVSVMNEPGFPNERMLRFPSAINSLGDVNSSFGQPAGGTLNVRELFFERGQWFARVEFSQAKALGVKVGTYSGIVSLTELLQGTLVGDRPWQGLSPLQMGDSCQK